MKLKRYQHIFGPYNRYLRAEFLPRWIQYGPTAIYMLRLALRARSLYFFTATNPGLPLGGIYPSSKKAILDQLPTYCVPKDTLLQAPLDAIEAYCFIQKADIQFPLVVKPNQGINGKRVVICHTKEDRDNKIIVDCYFDQTQSGTRIVQEYADYQQEYGIMYVRLPGEKQGRVTGIVQREFHIMVGDGTHTLEELVHADPRARYRYPAFAHTHREKRHTVIPQGEEIMLVDVGNHVRGVTFRDMSHLITPILQEEMDTISQQINGFYIGRYDIKADSIQGIIDRHYRVVELNATYAEPTRMYDPSYNRYDVTRILCQHVYYIYQVAINNKKRGVSYASYSEYKTMQDKWKY